MERKWWFAVGGAALAAGLIAGLAWWRLHLPKPQAPVVQKAQALPPGTEIRASGVLRAQKLIPVPSPVSGVLEEFAVKTGDEVFEGQILVTVNNEALRNGERDAAMELDRAKVKLSTLENESTAARLEQSRAEADSERAQAGLSRAERDYNRQALLNREGATPRRVYEAAAKLYETNKTEAEMLERVREQAQRRAADLAKDVDVARNAVAEREKLVEQAHSDAQRAQITSPVDGLVVAVHKNNGDSVAQGSEPVLDVAVDLGALELAAPVAPDVAKRLKPGQDAIVEIQSVPGQGLPGRVKGLQGDSVIVEFASPSPLIRPTMNATARLKLP